MECPASVTPLECRIKTDTTQQVDASFEREVPAPPFRCPEGTQDNDGDKVCAPSCATTGLSCSADGPCSDSSGSATCTCPPEWSGPSCTQCAPTTGQAIYLFTVDNATNGNLGGRSGADAKAPLLAARLIARTGPQTAEVSWAARPSAPVAPTNGCTKTPACSSQYYLHALAYCVKDGPP